jgi:hypothetical protein
VTSGNAILRLEMIKYFSMSDILLRRNYSHDKRSRSEMNFNMRSLENQLVNCAPKAQIISLSSLVIMYQCDLLYVSWKICVFFIPLCTVLIFWLNLSNAVLLFCLKILKSFHFFKTVNDVTFSLHIFKTLFGLQ